MSTNRTDHIITALRKDILRLEGFKSVNNAALEIKLGSLNDAFPNGIFPLGAIHEFLSIGKEDAAATSGFVGGLLSSIMGNNGTALWISSSRTLFPPALKSFGISPDRFIFIDLQKEKDVLWAIDEALKCSALTAVVGEVQEISFTASRRLQLAVEQSQVTGFILCRKQRNLNTTACVSRWRITSLLSEQIKGLPGIGFPKWKVTLLKMRNGKTGSWNLQWINGKFEFAYQSHFQSVYQFPSFSKEQAYTENIFEVEQKKAG